MSAANQQQEKQLIPVGAHECVTCKRCACTFSIVHPACPSCSAGERSWLASKAILTALETARDEAIARATRFYETATSAVTSRHAAETALQEIVAFPVDEGKSGGWHFAEVRQIARAYFASPDDVPSGSADAAAKETTDYLYPGCGCPLCRPRTT